MDNRRFREYGNAEKDICRGTGNDHKRAMSFSERMLLHFEEFLNEIGYWDLPYVIKKAHISDIGQVRNLELEFTYGFNIIFGRGASGKTALLKVLAENRVEVETTPGKCILFDDPTRLLPLDKKRKLFEMIKRRFQDHQIIVTIRSPQEDWILHDKDAVYHKIFLPYALAREPEDVVEKSIKECFISG